MVPERITEHDLEMAFKDGYRIGYETAKQEVINDEEIVGWKETLCSMLQTASLIALGMVAGIFLCKFVPGFWTGFWSWFN